MDFGRPKGQSQRLSAGIHPNWGITSATVVTTDKGNKYIEVVGNSVGGVAIQKIWYPKLEGITPKAGQTLQDAKDAAIDAFTGSVYTLLDALGVEQDVKGKTADEFATKACAVIMASDNKKCTIVLQWDTKDEWPEFPRYRWAFHSEIPLANIDASRYRLTKGKGTSTGRRSSVGEHKTDEDYV